ncbi:IS110 family transposase [Sinorhizobium americanum]|uniref:Transposase n=1 Tax=Sinorhizobium americanum TaxID=194963 RepID=A0A1L3LSS0_9HYPH|nr:IS110 family transposase [Sinorhizobium americanum]APG93125.1 transposase [Sinorhizobium americanum]APG93847.1 transposase [Sinorhizobium americanum]OAP50420.1 transposase [Sinorhizobium americanum]
MAGKKFIGLDVHQDTIAIAVADDGVDSEVRYFGTIANRPEALHSALKKIGQGGSELRVCYESGPCGFIIYRLLAKLGVDCMVISPSSMPRRPGDRVKTDRRDAQTLARLLRAGELVAVWVPDEAHEAVRDVVRARRQAKDELGAAKSTLKSFLLRHGRRFNGKAIWGKAHWGWLSEQKFAFPHQQFVFEEYKRRIHDLIARCNRLDDVLKEAVSGWVLGPLVHALQALRGIKLTAAATLVAEIGDLHRFDSPKQLMAWLGLVPAEHSSGKRIRRGEITRSGNAAARTMLIESAWHYRFPAREGRSLIDRNAEIPEDIRAIAWKAQVRLCAKFRRLVASGKQTVKVVTAVARELAGFIWDIARQTPPVAVEPRR